MPHRCLLLFACLLLSARSVAARVPPPGTFSAALQLGPGFVFAPLLGGARTPFVFAVEGEYAVDSQLAAVVDLGIGAASSPPLRLHAGARYRLGGLALPLSPFAQLQLGYGRLFDIIGADLNYLSARVGIGADYLLTARWSAGLMLAVDIGSTLGSRPALWGSTDLLLRAAASF